MGLLIANALLALLFVFGAAVQYNDPDPLRWMAIYLAAAVACVLAVLGRLRWWLPAAVGGVALVWAALLSPRVVGRVGVAELFPAWEMGSLRIEEGREMYGLLIIAFWMAVLVVAARRQPIASGRA